MGHLFNPLGRAAKVRGNSNEKADLLTLETTADLSTTLRSGRDDKGKSGGEGER
jgi:hypothetical protein